MSMNNVQKKLRITEESARLLSALSTKLNMSESAFVSELIRNYAIDLGEIEGIKNYALEEAMLVPSYEKKASSNNLAEEVSKLRQEMRIVKSIVNELDEYAYTERDMLNAVLLFLKPENDPQSDRKFKSTDTKLSILNRENIHSFLVQSISNYEERIRRSQIDGANK